MAPDDDDVQLPDLQVIQRYSLAVRGATARRADVVAALEADLAWLTGGRRRTTASPRPPAALAPAEANKTVAAAAPSSRAAASKPPAKEAAAAKPPAKEAAAAKARAGKAATAKPLARKTAAATPPAKRSPAKSKPGARRR